MAKIDRVKEFINYLKVLLVFLLATSVGLIAWLAQNYDSASSKLLYLAAGALIAIFIFIVMLNRKILKDIESLEEY